MPPRGWRLRLQDILDAIDMIQDYAAHLGKSEFIADQRTVDAVLYRVGVIGEAVRTLPDELKDRHPEIPWRDIRNMRNVLSHVYFGVDLERVWEVAATEAEVLRVQILHVIEAEGPAAP